MKSLRLGRSDLYSRLMRSARAARKTSSPCSGREQEYRALKPGPPAADRWQEQVWRASTKGGWQAGLFARCEIDFRAIERTTSFMRQPG